MYRVKMNKIDRIKGCIFLVLIIEDEAEPSTPRFIQDHVEEFNQIRTSYRLKITMFLTYGAQVTEYEDESKSQGPVKSTEKCLKFDDFDLLKNVVICSLSRHMDLLMSLINFMSTLVDFMDEAFGKYPSEFTRCV